MTFKTLQYLMGHSDISVTMNTYIYLGLDDTKYEIPRLEELENARKEVDKTSEKAKPLLRVCSVQSDESPPTEKSGAFLCFSRGIREELLSLMENTI